MQEEVKGKSKPLLAILNPETRKVVQRQFEEKVLPLFYEKASELIAAGATRDFGRELVSTHPAYEAFRRNPTPENLLNALRLRGYVQIADELGKQDITKLITYHREMLS